MAHLQDLLELEYREYHISLPLKLFQFSNPTEKCRCLPDTVEGGDCICSSTITACHVTAADVMVTVNPKQADHPLHIDSGRTTCYWFVLRGEKKRAGLKEEEEEDEEEKRIVGLEMKEDGDEKRIVGLEEVGEDMKEVGVTRWWSTLCGVTLGHTKIQISLKEIEAACAANDNGCFEFHFFV